MWYKVDWNRLVLLLLPSMLRRPVLFAYLKSLITPIESLHYQWKLMREGNLKKLSYNGQRCYLRKALNDECDTDLRRIYIGETLNSEPDYIYTSDENLDVYLGTMYLENDFDYNTGVVDFLVFVPQEVLNFKINQLIAILDFYTLAGKKYEIIGL